MYSSVLVWQNLQFENATKLGDVLADFIDAGFTVVIANYALSFNAIGGRFRANNYSPIVAAGMEFGPQSMVTVNAAHPLLAGVDRFEGIFICLWIVFVVCS